MAAPDNITLVTDPDDDACLARVADGDADAMVTAAWPRADIASRSGYRVLQETEMALEPRAIVARSDGPDPTELLVALDDAIRALRADGMLTDLARRPGDVAARSTSVALAVDPYLNPYRSCLMRLICLLDALGVRG